jgi:fructose-1,6-bisphosphatase/inositol monophosphatase family enzyme
MRETLELISERVRDAIWDLPESFDWGLELGMGADGTPTSNIDKAAEDVILECVEEMDLPYNVLSEEAGLMDRGYDRTLVVDPIDGTHNSILGIPLYSVSLAVGSSSLCGVDYGLVRNLVNDDVFYAERGKGALLNGTEVKVKKYHPGTSAFLVYMGQYAHPRTLEVVKRSARTRGLGCASLEMCLVAQGKFDAYYMNCVVHDKAVRVVDIAASALVLREAGGEIVDLEGERLDMPFDLRCRSNFLAYGDGKVKEAIL